jgi:hypothetical protein
LNGDVNEKADEAAWANSTLLSQFTIDEERALRKIYPSKIIAGTIRTHLSGAWLVRRSGCWIFREPRMRNHFT